MRYKGSHLYVTLKAAAGATLINTSEIGQEGTPIFRVANKKSRFLRSGQFTKSISKQVLTAR